MGREIEIKIPLEHTEYQSIFSLIQGQSTVKGIAFSQKTEHILKSDKYFSRYKTREERKQNNEPTVIRLRSEQNLDTGTKESFFCIKTKTVENGIELNREDETVVKDETVLERLFETTGFIKYFEKQKDAFSTYCSLDGSDINFHLELEKVNNLEYVEIEVTDSTQPADQVRAGLEKLVAGLGLDASKKDSRSWMDIVQQNKE